MSTVQQAELQGQIWKAVEAYRQRHGLSYAALFDFLVCFAWGYARRQPHTSSEEIQNRMRAHCEACELAYQRAVGPALPEVPS
jgi:GTP cyclohydrolase III